MNIKVEMIRTYIITTLLTLSLFIGGCEETDLDMAARSAADAVRAVTLDDQDVRRIAMEVSGQLDSKHTVATPESSYVQRLERLLGSRYEWMNQKFNFEIYLSQQINAFALADGSIRIYSGLMDKMTDKELLFVLGHEMGHVIEDHVKEKLRLAYAGSALRKAIASQEGYAGEIAGSVLGAFAQNLLNAQFSQKEEREADDYGVAFLRDQGLEKKAAVSALMKLAQSGGAHSFLSSHPAPESRAERLRQQKVFIDPTRESSFRDRIAAWLNTLWKTITEKLDLILN